MTKIGFSLILTFFSFHLLAQDWNETQKLTSDDRNAEDFFGESVAIDDNYAITGAPGHTLDNNDSNSFELAGAAYIFEKNEDDEWIQIQKLIASDRVEDDIFGVSVAISNHVIVVGAQWDDEGILGQNSLEDAGSVYIFEKNSDNLWQELQKVTASDRAAEDYFGAAVAISGNRIVIGAERQDFDEMGENEMDRAGAAYIFERNESTGLWEEVQKIVSSNRQNRDSFGGSVAIQDNHIVVGAQFRWFGNGPNDFADVGLAYLFEKDSDGNWEEIKVISPSEQGDYHYFGRSVAINGDYVFVSSPGHDVGVFQSGAVFVYKKSVSSFDSTTILNQVQFIEPDYQEYQSYFGHSIHASGDYAIFGTYLQDINNGDTVINSGAAYIYKKAASGNTWNELQTVVASDRANSDLFGISVGISHGYAIVGANLSDTEADGQNFKENAGAAYILDFAGDIINSTIELEPIALDFYPNPTSKQVNIDLGEQQSITNLYLRSVDGRLLDSQQFQNTQLIQYDILAPVGFYFLEIVVNNRQSKTIKIVKSNE